MAYPASQLAPGQNYDRRSRTVPLGIVKYNAMLDLRAIKLRTSRIANRPASVLYKGSALRGDYSGKENVAFDVEPAFVYRQTALLGAAGRFSAKGTQELGHQENRIPIVSTVNGEEGQTADEIEDRLLPIGFTNQPGTDGGEVGLNVISGGLLTTINPSQENIRMADYVRIKVPTEQEAAKIMSIAGEKCNSLGKDGRIRPLLVPYRPQDMSFLNDGAVFKAINEMYDLTDAAYVARNSGPAAVNPFRVVGLYLPKDKASKWGLEGMFRHGVSELVESLAQILSLALPAAAVVLVQGAPAQPYNANEQLAYARTYVIGLLHILARTSAAVDMGKIRPAGFHAGIARIMDAFYANASFKANVIAKNPINRMIQALAAFKQRVEQWVCGRAVQGAPPGNDFDLHLRNYAF